MFNYSDFKIGNIVLTSVEQGLVGINWSSAYTAHVFTRVTSSMVCEFYSYYMKPMYNRGCLIHAL